MSLVGLIVEYLPDSTATHCLQGAIKSSQMVNRTLLQEIEEVAFALLRNVFPFLGVDSIHGHQHPLILTPTQ